MLNILNILKFKGAVTYIIVPPILKNHIDILDLPHYESMKQGFYNIIKKLNCKYDFKLLDYSELFNLQPQYFYDFEHLNEAGRQEFTKIINQSILE